MKYYKFYGLTDAQRALNRPWIYYVERPVGTHSYYSIPTNVKD